MRRNDVWAALVALGLSGAAGCLVVTPLDELPAKSKTTQGGKGGSGIDSAEAGAGGAGDTRGPGGAGGAGGAGGEAEQPHEGGSDTQGPTQCQTNAECVRGSADEPYRCRPSDHKCVALTNELCPLAYGDDITNPNAVYFGAFATLDQVTPEDNAIVLAQQLAIRELNGDGVNGLPDGPDSQRRPLVMIVCQNADTLVEPALKYLVEEVEVPALIGTLKPGDLLRAFETYKKRDVFYLSPVSVTSSVVTEEDDGHIWSMLGQPSDLADTYVALLKRSEAWLREDRGLASATALKVALVTTGDAFDSELRNALLPVLEFNGASITDNDDNGNFLSIELNGGAQDLADNALDVAEFAPDIVISAASELFVMDGGLQENIENEWDLAAGGHPRPFYILSPYNAGDVTDLMERISGRLENDVSAGEDQQRYVGVSIAAAANNTLQNAYATRLRSAFKGAIVDTANFYDAVYYLAYAMYGANEPDGLTGTGIARGMTRLLSGDDFSVTPVQIGSVFKALRSKGATIHLASTLGPPDFDPDTGLRPVDGSVFCFRRAATTVKLVPDALRYDGASKALVGDFDTCNSGF